MLFFFILPFCIPLFAQKGNVKEAANDTTDNSFSVTGIVKDAETKLPLPFCNVIVLNTFIGTSTDESGKFKLLIPENNPSAKLIIVTIGYTTDTFEINPSKNNYQIFLHSTHSMLKEVVVTEFSREYLLKEEPSSIKIVTSIAIEKTTESNLIDVLVKNVPGLNAVKTGPNVSKPFIHGLGYNRIETNYDGVPVEGQQFEDEEVLPVDMYNIERAEVTLGPTCLMDGPDALGGLISLIPSMPKDVDKVIHGRMFSEYQSNNGLIGNGIRLTYGNSYWGFAVRGSYRIAKNYSNKLDGRVYNTGFREANGSATIVHKTYNGSSNINFTFYDNSQEIPDGSRDSLTRKFTKAVYDDHYDTITSRPIVPDDELNSYRLSPVYQHIQHYRIYSNNHYIFRDNSSIDGMLSFQQNNRSEYDSPINSDRLGVSLRLNSWNYDWRYHLPKISQVETVVGINGMYQTNTNINANDVPIPDYRLLDIGSFIFAKWRHQKWTLSSGIGYNSRKVIGNDLYSREDTANGVVTQVFPPDTMGAKLLFPAFKKRFNGIFADVGATFLINDHVNIKTNFARGTGAPHVSEFASNGLDGSAHSYFIGKKDLVPEYCWQADFGMSINYKDVDASLNIYYTDFEKYIYLIQVVDPNGNPLEIVPGNKTYQYQQGAAELYGVESMINIHPKSIKGFSFINYFSLVHGFNLEPLYKNKGMYGEYLPQIPPMKLLSTINQNIKTKSNVISLVTLIAEADINAAQNRYLALNQTETATPGYVLYNVGVNCSVNYTKKLIFQFQIQLNNLFNTDYQSHLSRLKYFEYYSQSTNGHYGLYNMGRNICFKLIIPF